METINLKKMHTPLRLMIAFAHPDDESFGPSGTILHYSARNVAVHYVCATRGEAGDVDPEYLQGNKSLAELRTRELLCAARHLELAAVHFLDYHDSGMADTPQNQNPASLFQAPLEEVAEKITLLIRRIRPQVVVTFDPQGGYFHPDHIKMNQAATMAFHAAGDAEKFPAQLASDVTVHQPLKLYYTAFPHTFVKWMVRIMPLLGRDPAAWGRNGDINLLRIAAIKHTVTTRIKTTPYYRTRRLAVGCHASQTSGNRNLLRVLLDRLLIRSDNYTRIIPRYEGKGLEYDLFEGVY